MGRIERIGRILTNEMTVASWPGRDRSTAEFSLFFWSQRPGRFEWRPERPFQKNVRPGSLRLHDSPHEERFVKCLLIRPIRVQNGWSRPDDRAPLEQVLRSLRSHQDDILR